MEKAKTKGKSEPEKKTKEAKPKIKQAEIEKLVVELAKKGNQPEKIGLILKQKHNIPKAKTSIGKIGKILKKNKIDLKSDLENVEKRIEKLKKHLEKNKHDYRTQRTLHILAGRLNSLRKYYGIEVKRRGKNAKST